MPTQNQERWYHDGFLLRDMLKDKGYDVELFYGGDDDIPIQKRQIPRLIHEGYQALIIGPIDGTKLTDELVEAKEKGIPVISYDRLIMGSDAVSYYVSFNNKKVGILQGQDILDKINIEDGKIKYLEIFYGSLGDNNARFFYDGAMEVLRPYIEKGQIVVLSNEISPEQTNIPKWDTDLALKRMDRLISKYNYGPSLDKQRLDAVLSPSDALTAGIVVSLRKAGFTKDNFPVVTGQDCDAKVVEMILNGEVSMSVFKDTRLLNEQVIEMIDAISSNKEVKVNDTTSYDNGKGFVKSYLCEPVVVDKDNYKKILVDNAGN